jgi:hypothetical protein
VPAATAAAMIATTRRNLMSSGRDE